MNMTDTDRDLYFEFLDELRESGEANMYGAGSYLQDAFPELAIDRKGARRVVLEWMDTYAERHPKCP